MSFMATTSSLAGFRLIGRRPGTILVWALVWLLLVYGPLAVFLPQWLTAILGALRTLRDLHQGDVRETIQGMLRWEVSLMKLVAPWTIWGWLVGTVLSAAVYRSVIDPRSRGFAYLRLSGDELRLLLLQIILALLWTAFLAAVIGAGAALFIAAGSLQPAWRTLAGVLGVLALAVVCVYVPLRFVFAAPMTIADQRLRIFESWGLTSGRMWKVLGLVLLVTILVLTVAYAGALIANAFLYGALGPGLVTAFMPGAETPPPPPWTWQSLISGTGALVLAAVLVQAVLQTLVRVIALAPFAAAYKSIAGEE